MQPISEKDKKKKLAALKKVMGGLQKKTGDGNIIQILGQKPMDDKERFQTGFLTLDYATGGGIRRGTIGELFGPESSGKSLVCQKIIAAAQKIGAVCAYVDMEQTFDPIFAQKLGVLVDELILSQPRSLQQAFEVIDGLVDAGIDIIVLDSVATLVPEEELEGEIGKQTIGLVARYMSQFLRRLNVKIADSQSSVLFVNQVRDKVGVLYGNPEETPGGKALKFYCSLRMRVSKSAEGMIKPKADAEPIGQGIRVKCVKNKTAPPFRQAEFKVYFDGRETSEIDEIADIALAKGLIPKYNAAGELTPTGRQYRWPDEPEFLAKSKAEVPVQLEKFPKVAKALKEIIVSGQFDKNTVDYDGKSAEDMDSDYEDEDFEALMKEEANAIENGSEAEEIESSFDGM